MTQQTHFIEVQNNFVFTKRRTNLAPIILAIVLLFGGRSSQAGPVGAIHYPDLQTLPPSDIHLEYDPGSGQRLLRFSNAIANLGEGPFEVFPQNNPDTGTTDAFQRLFSHDTNGNWYAVATNYVGTFVLHPQHNHWHFENFARYELHDVAPDGSIGTNVLAYSAKVSFCLEDSVQVDSTLEHSGAQTYIHCDQVEPQGISVGWADVYPWTLYGESVDVTQVPDGDYWLVSTADPDGVIIESGARVNNTGSVKVHIDHGNPVWVDDAIPLGAWTGADGGDAWQWVNDHPEPFSGLLAHQSSLAPGVHCHYFTDAAATLTINAGDTLITYVYLDTNHPPREIMLQWFDGASWAHAAYWGENLIPWGSNGTASQRPMGPLPPAGQWVRLEVPANLLDLEGCVLTGMNFILFDGQATWDYSGAGVSIVDVPPPDNTPPAVSLTSPANDATVSGTSVTVSAEASDNVGVVGVQFKLDGANLGPETTAAPCRIGWNTTAAANGTHTLIALARDAAGNQTVSGSITVHVTNEITVAAVWVDDAVPAGAWTGADGGDSWSWASVQPTPFAGARAHQSTLANGVHYHYFADASATLALNTGDTLTTYVYLDSDTPPREILLQWFDGQSWAHAAYWGENLIPWGDDGTPSQQPMGALPSIGQWVRLEVPASLVDLEGRTLSGMNFILYDGRASWDYSGKLYRSSPPPADTTPPTVAITAPSADVAVSGNVTVSASASDNAGVAGVQFKLDGVNLGFEITSASYVLSWDTTSFTDGRHTLTAVAHDGAGNQSTSTPVAVTINNAGRSTTVWLDDAVPEGAWTGADGGDIWNWVGNNPAPYSGALAHQSSLAPGIHYHYFADAQATLTVDSSDTLGVYVQLDAANPPREIMLQWYDGESWAHAAYWGENLIPWGENGTPSQQFMGELPAAGGWVRLNVPCTAVGLGVRPVSGMNFILYDGRATWDYVTK